MKLVAIASTAAFVYMWVFLWYIFDVSWILRFEATLLFIFKSAWQFRLLANNDRFWTTMPVMIGRIFAVQLDQSPQTACDLPTGRFIQMKESDVQSMKNMCKQFLGSFKQSRIYDISLACVWLSGVLPVGSQPELTLGSSVHLAHSQEWKHCGFWEGLCDYTKYHGEGHQLGYRTRPCCLGGWHSGNDEMMLYCHLWILYMF